MKTKPYLRQIVFERDDVPNLDAYPFNIPALKALDTLDFHADVTFLIGENGSGKSTLIEAIARTMGFGPEGGTKNVKLETADTVSSLHRYLRPVRGVRAPRDGYFLRAESFYNVATYMDEVGYLGGYGDLSLHQRSHGEAFMAVLTEKLAGKGFYILDEPEAALSPMRQLAALTAIDGLVRDGSQFVIATHSPILLAYPRAQILALGPDGIAPVQYEDTEHYVITRRFLNDHERMLEQLLDGE